MKYAAWFVSGFVGASILGLWILPIWLFLFAYSIYRWIVKLFSSKENDIDWSEVENQLSELLENERKKIANSRETQRGAELIRKRAKYIRNDRDANNLIAMVMDL